MPGEPRTMPRDRSRSREPQGQGRRTHTHRWVGIHQGPRGALWVLNNVTTEPSNIRGILLVKEDLCMCK